MFLSLIAVTLSVLAVPRIPTPFFGSCSDICLEEHLCSEQCWNPEAPESRGSRPEAPSGDLGHRPAPASAHEGSYVRAGAVAVLSIHISQPGFWNKTLPISMPASAAPHAKPSDKGRQNTAPAQPEAPLPHTGPAPRCCYTTPHPEFWADTLIYCKKAFCSGILYGISFTGILANLAAKKHDCIFSH